MYREYINVVLMDLPHSIRGFVTRNEDDTYTIVLNARMCYEMQFDTYVHELSHICEQDFQMNDVQIAETIAHLRENHDALRNAVL